LQKNSPEDALASKDISKLIGIRCTFGKGLPKISTFGKRMAELGRKLRRSLNGRINILVVHHVDFAG
jgi:hypothetical protein